MRATRGIGDLRENMEKPIKNGKILCVKCNSYYHPKNYLVCFKCFKKYGGLGDRIELLNN